MFFLLTRIEQTKKIKDSKNLLISDFILVKTIYFKLNLDQMEYDMYSEIKQKLGFDPPIPDLIIYLQASTDILLRE